MQIKKNIFIKNNASIKDALTLLDSTGENCLLVVRKGSYLLGTLTDGDIRRAILKNIKITNSIDKIYNKKCNFVFEHHEIGEIKKIMLGKKVDLVPVVNNFLQVTKYYTWEEAFNDKKKIIKNPKNSTKVVIMAGGKGVRLQPFTDVLPKPLIPIGNETIIEKIINNFNDNGISNFYITTNYKSKIMKSYLNEINGNNKFSFINEKSPQGTAGSLEKLKNKLKDPFILTNCDTLVNINFADLISFHKSKSFSITIVTAIKDYQIPYGVCEIDTRQKLKKIDEKPIQNILINTGVYVVSPNILEMIAKNEYIDFTDLINRVKKNKKLVGVYPIFDKSWIDIGQWSEYREALQKF